MEEFDLGEVDEAEQKRLDLAKKVLWVIGCPVAIVALIILTLAVPIFGGVVFLLLFAYMIWGLTKIQLALEKSNEIKESQFRILNKREEDE